MPRPLVQEIFALPDQAYDLLHERLGDHPRGEITALLYSRLAFRDVTETPEWAGGIYDGKIPIPVGGLTTTREAVNLQSIVVHEMTRAFLCRMAPAGLPRWFHEGLATAAQGWDAARIRAWFAPHPPDGLGTLAGVDRALEGRGGDVVAAYGAARLALDDVVEMRLDPAEFEERWGRALR